MRIVALTAFRGTLTLILAATPAAAQQPSTPSTVPARSELLDRVRQGGLVVACRHALTDHSRQDIRPIDTTDRSKQRNLTDRGRAQAESLGLAIRAARVPVGEVFTSPMYRTRESGELAFGRVITTPLLWDGQEHRGTYSALFHAPVVGGANRFLISHQAVISTIPGRRGALAEGDCVVLEPAGDGKVNILGVLKPADWRSGDEGR
jgi:phosphohistidine phosphatase SixA